MENLFTILLFLISWRFSPVPYVLAPTPHGLFQDYGFEQNDSEKFAPILHLLQMGVYKVIEEDSSYALGQDTSIFNIFSHGDSVIIEEQSVYHNIPGSKFIEKYSRKGKLLYRGSEQEWAYFNTDGSWVVYKHLRPTSHNHWFDKTILKKKITYDKLGRPIESGEYDEYDEFMDYGKIARKILYRYNNSSVETNDYVRKSGNRYDTTKTFKEYEKERRFGPVEYVIYNREIKKIDSAARSIETETYNYNQPYGDTDQYHRTYNLTYYDYHWHPISEKWVHQYSGVEKTEGITEYERDKNGLLLRKDSETWSYDKNGNCVIRIDYGTKDTWTYDTRGNLVEYNNNGNINRFKLFYK